MALPVTTRTWVISPCNRIVFVSLLDTMQRYLFAVKQFLKANSWTVKGSCSAGTGAMDAVDRWSSFSSVTPRATVAAASQGWIVLTNSVTGIDLLIAFQGSSDDICRFSYSPGGLFIVAGTANQQPTAVDEVVDHGFGISVISSTSSGDRLWSGWASTDGKAFRFALARGGLWIGRSWGVESYTSTMSSPAIGAPASNPSLFLSIFNINGIPSASQFGRTRLIVASVPSSVVAVHLGVKSWPLNGSTSLYAISFGAEKAQLQGSLGYPILPLSFYGNTGGYRGKIGDAIDQWAGRSAGDNPGDTYGPSLQFINMFGYFGSNGGGGVWPWDGITVPVMT
jgi:hypothetical protein